MAFSVPTFNLMADIYTGPWPTAVLRLSLPCNLALGRRVGTGFSSGGVPPLEPIAYGLVPQLLVPAKSDVRDQSTGFPSDIVEVPSGSGRWYGVTLVDDVGRGFSNEYRIVSLSKVFQDSDGPGTYVGLFWPIPIP